MKYNVRSDKTKLYYSFILKIVKFDKIHTTA